MSDTGPPTRSDSGREPSIGVYRTTSRISARAASTSASDTGSRSEGFTEVILPRTTGYVTAEPSGASTCPLVDWEGAPNATTDAAKPCTWL